MTRAKIFATLACAGFFACERDPASNVKIIARPVAPAGSAADTAKFAPPPPFHADLCKLQPEQAKGSSKIVFSGPCNFSHSGDVKCRAALDDFYTMLVRQGPGNATTSVYLNVETFGGPGTYGGGQMFLTVQNGDAYYYWSNDSVRTHVGPGMKYVDVEKAPLPAEPPNTGVDTVSGRFWCDPHATFDTSKIVR
ncbi:MAG: hypothetical protein ABR582_06210 [Gemmatimonadaceae bacterium]